MTNRTAPVGAAAEGPSADPPDILVMRQTAQILLNPDAVALAPSADHLATLTTAMRGHLELLVDDVERASRSLDEASALRYCALACVGEARGKLRAEPSHGPGGALGYARRVARVLDALCDHHDKLSSRP